MTTPVAIMAIAATIHVVGKGSDCWVFMLKQIVSEAPVFPAVSFA